ncbi:MAG: biotin--[acetyl-CoA-carboxylase] ligase [Prevotellaceae bacterium]|jgi:BirA family biotin operon repressor/biotin-[acetyl-CoA-carboxylase] ligase|nr:biotin--[acetyl-CoA-carboxylase] ligase [Prevotellaceae bacterium]
MVPVATAIVINSIFWFGEIDSTNNEAYRNLATAQHGTVWAARFQTAGRGQKGNRWESAVGENLTFSVLLRPLFLPPERQFLISQTVAIAMCDLLGGWGIEAKIKWPNDIYIGDKKVQGMLIEHHLSGSQISASIVGVGLNLNQVRFASDAPNPTSVFLETDVRHDPEEVLQALLVFLWRRYGALERGEWEEVDADYGKRLYRRGQWATYQRCATQTHFLGKIEGVDRLGCLMVSLENGKIETFSFQEIKYLR